MQRIQVVSKENASDKVKSLYDLLQKKLGKVPNIFLTMGHSPLALQAFLALSDLVEKTSLSPEIRSKLALIVGQTNNCNYCLSAHSAIAKAMGLQDADILNARKANAQDKKTQAILRFAKSVVEKRGEVTDKEVQELKQQGVTDQQIVEIVLVITLNNFTNYFNKVAGTQIDFPPAPSI